MPTKQCMAYFILNFSGTPYQVIMPSGHPPPAMTGNQLASISQPGTSIAGGITVIPGQAIQAHPNVAGSGPPASGANMLPLSMSTSTNSTPYQFPITSHTNVTNIQPTPAYPANAAQTIIYVS